MDFINLFVCLCLFLDRFYIIFLTEGNLNYPSVCAHSRTCRCKLDLARGCGYDNHCLCKQNKIYNDPLLRTNSHTQLLGFTNTKERMPSLILCFIQGCHEEYINLINMTLTLLLPNRLKPALAL